MYRVALTLGFIAFTLGFLTQVGATLIKETPLKERIDKADKVFLGKVINRVEKGDWIHAELLVLDPIFGTKKGEKIKVIWRKSTATMKLFDVPTDTTAIAILKDTYKERYFLRRDRFEKVELVHDIRELVKKKVDLSKTTE